MMKNKRLYNILILSGMLLIGLYFVFSAVVFTKKKDNVVCDNVEIILLDKNKIELINTIDIEQFLIANNLYPLGKQVKDIHTEEIEQALNSNEMIKSSQCYTTPSGNTYIKIKQRIPKFRIIGNDNYYVDTERKRIKTSVNYTAYVPIVSGKVDYEMASEELFDFVNFLEKNTFWNAQIEQIHIRDDKKVELVPRVGDHIILLGTLDNYEHKLDKLKKLYIKGFNTIGWNNYKTIDLQYKGQIVCTNI